MVQPNLAHNRNRMAPRKLALACAVALALVAGSGTARQGSENLVGKPAPTLKVSKWINTNGKTLSLSGLRGKVVVLDFWAFW